MSKNAVSYMWRGILFLLALRIGAVERRDPLPMINRTPAEHALFFSSPHG